MSAYACIKIDSYTFEYIELFTVIFSIVNKFQAKPMRQVICIC